ncbi:MAG: ComEC/Rec2 family competence protein [Planctomycetia bacterium]|nr:ComEC/Rec2 family competence protein [Planctomycetia bacterium]
MTSLPARLGIPGEAVPAPFVGGIGRAPLVPIAVAFTAGVVLDRLGDVPFVLSLVAVVAFLAAWAISRQGRPAGLPVAYLLGAVLALGAAYHHGHRDLFRADDIGNLAHAEARPARLRGVLVAEPVFHRQPSADPLRAMPRPSSSVGVLQVTAYQTTEAWVPVSGRVRLVVEGPLFAFHAGDELEAVGRLSAPHGPANPGEADLAAPLRDRRIRAVLLVDQTSAAVMRLGAGWTTSLTGWLGVVRGWGQRQLAAALPAEQSGLAMALLLGEGSTLSAEDWQKFQRTGVVHLLVISGQHLVVLAAFLWLLCRLAGVRRRRAALFVALFLFAYALLTGGQPPVMRSAVTVCAAVGGLVLCRPALPANSFALAWLVVAFLNPTDMFASGCQLSFLTVAVLIWGAGRWFMHEPDELEQLEDEARPPVQRNLRRLGRWLWTSYAVTLTVWLAAAPLIAFHYHLVSPIGVLIGPPLMVLMSVALIAGFLLLLAAAVLPWLVPLFAAPTAWSLATCDALVTYCDGLPGAAWYTGDIPLWWLALFYAGLLAMLVLRPLQLHWRWATAAALGWFCVGLAGGSARPAPTDELRCTFLAVGHGGCTVLEIDGRVLLYDAGAMNGPEVTARHIAPYLWSRGIRRIDEVFLSHADLDHFNGLPALLERFAVGQVTGTPTFASRQSPSVRLALQQLERRGVPWRVVQAGDRLQAGALDLEVLHPPASGPPGKENHRSLVLRVRHLHHVLLLTGDLEGPGLDLVLRQPALPVDVLLAPHHGSQTANTSELAEWARPKLVVSCEGPPRGPLRAPEPYTERGSVFLGTWPHGAVTVHSSPAGLRVETFASGQRFWLAR